MLHEQKGIRVILSALLAIAVLLLLLSTCKDKPQPDLSPVSPIEAVAQIAKTPTAIPTVDVPGNLLVNPSFEGPYVNCGDACNVAPGWQAWKGDCFPPICYGGEDGCVQCPSNCTGCAENKDRGCWCAPAEIAGPGDWRWGRVYSGASSQKTFVSGRVQPSGFGVYQVGAACVGCLIEGGIHAKGWQCYKYMENLEVCGNGLSDQRGGASLNIQVGLDPTGGSDPLSSNIVWSEPVDSLDAWTLITVTARASSSNVTMFARCKPDFPFSHENNDCYYDDAYMVVVSEATPTPTPAPTATPVPFTATNWVRLPVVMYNYQGIFPPPVWWPTTPITRTALIVVPRQQTVRVGQAFTVAVMVANTDGVDMIEASLFANPTMIERERATRLTQTGQLRDHDFFWTFEAFYEDLTADYYKLFEVRMVAAQPGVMPLTIWGFVGYDWGESPFSYNEPEGEPLGWGFMPQLYDARVVMVQ
ncbi:MAG: hypothetical protein JW850_15170 [Thermoflexales bacterium]|nr:hypothetical protein [Thermoflexales bacterium]